MPAEISTRSRPTIYRVPADHPALDSTESFLKASPPPLPMGTIPLDLRVETTLPDILYLPELPTLWGEANPNDGPCGEPCFRLADTEFVCRPLGYRYLKAVYAHPEWKIGFADLFEQVHGEECPRLASGKMRGREHVGWEAARLRKLIRPLGYHIGVCNEHLVLRGPGQPV